MTQAQSSSDIPVQCIRCRNRHMESERQKVDAGNSLHALACPRCSCKSFYDMRPQAAWCWASGLIEMGDETAVPEGGIVIARGPKAFLNGTISALARHGRGANEGAYLVPGIPEADDCQKARGDALATWLKRCARNNGHKGRHGVVFVEEQD
jgi:DNA-directed RNA polymerase subunit RPC12/RpoP